MLRRCFHLFYYYSYSYFYNNNIYQMASSRRRNSSSKKSLGRRCGSGGRRKRTEKKLKHKWHQRGCQNQTGGGSMTGGWAWGPSDLHHQTAGSASGNDPVPHSINGNHYAFNANTMAPPQASNAIVERHSAAQTAGRRRRGRGRGRGRGRSSKGKKGSSRRISCQNGGGFADYLPEAIKPSVNTTLQIPGNIISGLQGPATASVSADPTSQPIGQPITLK
jgi:hypothetical protein